MSCRDRTEFLLFRLFQGALNFAPSGAAHKLLADLGLLLGRTRIYRHEVVRGQLALSFPDLTPGELDDLTARVYAHLGRTVGEIFRPGPDEDLTRIAVDPGWQVLDEALARGRGAIIASGHMGNFELAGALVGSRYKLLDVAKPQRNKLFDDFINDLRARRGIVTVPVEGSAVPVLRHLRSGGVVSLLLDQDAGQEGIPVEFFGRSASTWPGAARLSIATGCPVIPLALVRLPAGGHCLELGPALWPDGLTKDPDHVRDYLQRISLALEGFIRRHPEQWFWVHRRWKEHHRKSGDS